MDPERWSGGPCATLSEQDPGPSPKEPIVPAPCPVTGYPNRPPGPVLLTPTPTWEGPTLTASRCPRATERPMARGPEPPRSRRLLSVVASTHSTSCRVPMISMPRP